MKPMRWWLMLIAAGALVLPVAAVDPDQLKLDLIGQTMGGREKCWKFKSVDQIKELVIKNQTEEAHTRVYVLLLKLQAAKDSAQYRAEARVEYTKAANSWQVRQVGLLSLTMVR